MPRDQYGIQELISDFPQEEYSKRCEKARVLMDKEHVDGMLLGRGDNIAYFSGYRRIADYQFSYMMLPRDGDPVLVAPIDQRGNAEAMSWIEDIRFFGSSSIGLPDAKKIGIELLNELNFVDKVIGVENSPQVPQQEVWDALNNHVKKTKDIDDLIWDLRMVKSPLEIRQIRRACDIIYEGFTKALREVREGMSERELARIFYSTVIGEGAEDSPLKGVLHLGGGVNRYAMMDTRPTDNKFRKGDIVFLDGSITFRGYWCDMARLTCIGQPSQRQKMLFEACLEAQRAGVEALLPGRKISEIFKVIEQVIKEKGLIKNKYPGFGPWFGHSFGLDLHERPDIVPNPPDSSIILKPGMVLTMEPCLADDPVIDSVLNGYRPGGKGIFYVEDDVLITEKGPEILTPVPHELNIV